jgi:hypothetical protein
LAPAEELITKAGGPHRVYLIGIAGVCWDDDIDGLFNGRCAVTVRDPLDLLG